MFLVPPTCPVGIVCDLQTRRFTDKTPENTRARNVGPPTAEPAGPWPPEQSGSQDVNPGR